MLMASLSDPAVVAAIVALPSILVAYFGYQRGRRVDAVAEQSGIDMNASKGIDQIIEGQNRLVANLQQDNALLRDNVRVLDEKLSIVIRQCEVLRSEIRELKNGIRSG